MKSKEQVEKALERKKKRLEEQEVLSNKNLKRVVLNQIKVLEWVLEK